MATSLTLPKTQMEICCRRHRRPLRSHQRQPLSPSSPSRNHSLSLSRSSLPTRRPRDSTHKRLLMQPFSGEDRASFCRALPNAMAVGWFLDQNGLTRSRSIGARPSKVALERAQLRVRPRGGRGSWGSSARNPKQRSKSELQCKPHRMQCRVRSRRRRRRRLDSGLLIIDS